jgi:hypothetical protein
LDKSLGISFLTLFPLYAILPGALSLRSSSASASLIYGRCGNTETSVLFSWASFVSAFGSFLTYVALQVQIYSLTNLPPVALLGAVQLVPLGVTALWGGALADALDRRRLLPCCEVLLLCGSLSLAVNSMLPHSSEPFLFIVAAFMSAVGGFHTPALESLTPSRVEFRQHARRIYGGAVRSCTLDRLRGTRLRGWGTRVRAAVAGVLAVSEGGNESCLGAIAWPCRAGDSLGRGDGTSEGKQVVGLYDQENGALLRRQGKRFVLFEDSAHACVDVYLGFRESSRYGDPAVNDE